MTTHKLVEWKLADNPTSFYTEEFWYDLVRGGHIKPENILADASQIEELEKAIALVASFETLIDNLMDDME